MKKIMLLTLLLVCSACVKPVPIATAAMLPPEAVYTQTTSQFYLKRKVVVGEFEYAGTDKEVGAVTFSNFSMAVARALDKGGYLAPTVKGPYTLSGKILEVRVPGCGFGSCEGGSAIEYNLSNTKTGDVVYHEVVVVPYTSEAPVFSDNWVPVIMRAYHETIGANIAQVIQILNRKTAADLK